MIKVYSTPNCQYCDKVKTFLKENNKEYTEINIAEDAEAKAQMIEMTGQMKVPVITVGNYIIVGSDLDNLRKFVL